MQKLHPKTKWLFFIRYVFSTIILAAFVVPIGAAAGGGVVAIIAAVLLLVGTYVAALLSYNCYGYELADDAFKKEFGVIMRRNTSIPYERIQNVDIIRGLLSRMLGLADLNVQTAGGSSYGMRSEGRLPGLSKQDAIAMQTELLARARGIHNATKAPVNNTQNTGGL